MKVARGMVLVQRINSYLGRATQNSKVCERHLIVLQIKGHTVKFVLNVMLHSEEPDLNVLNKQKKCYNGYKGIRAKGAIVCSNKIETQIAVIDTLYQ